MSAAVRLCLFAFLVPLISSGWMIAQDQAVGDTQSSTGPDRQGQSTTAEDGSEPAEKGEQQSQFELAPDVDKVLSPLFSAIESAQVSRATVEVLSDSLVTGRIIESEKSTYQIASRAPNKFTVYLKGPSRRTRIYNDGESMVIALAPDAYFRVPDPISNQRALIELPVPMGPYPEPVMALALAGVDPSVSFVEGMKSIEIVGEKMFRGKVPSIHLHGVQADSVTWDLWITKDEVPVPLRLLVDLTPMLLASEDLKLPAGYSHQIRFDFLTWRISGKVDDALFSFKPASDAKEYQSAEQYDQEMATLGALPPLLGKPLPPFSATMLNGGEVKSTDLKGKVVVIDFWTTWHEPCAEILPAIKQVCGQFADQNVVFLALNVGEQESQIKEFLKNQ